VSDSNLGGGLAREICFSLSTDLIHRGPQQFIAPARLPWCDADPAAPGILKPVVILHPSLLDHADSGDSFDRTGQAAYLHDTRFNDGGLDHDLVRVGVTFVVPFRAHGIVRRFRALGAPMEVVHASAPGLDRAWRTG